VAVIVSEARWEANRLSEAMEEKNAEIAQLRAEAQTLRDARGGDVSADECVNSSFIHKWRLAQVTYQNGTTVVTRTIWYCTLCRKTEPYEG
jgi:hypothetical protein